MKSIASVLAGAVLLLTVLVGVFVLAWHGTITGAQALAVVTVIIGLAGGALSVAHGVQAGSNAATPPQEPPAK